MQFVINNRLNEYLTLKSYLLMYDQPNALRVFIA